MPVLTYEIRLYCVLASTVNAAHLAADSMAASAVLEFAGTEPRNVRKLEDASELLLGTGIIDARCRITKLPKSACQE